MISNICKIEKGTADLAAIFAECEKVAVYNELTHKQGLHLRLLCEEIDGMLPNIISDFEGNLWFDFADGVCKINISIIIPQFNADKKDELIEIAKDKKNAAAVGIVGKIRSAVEDFFLSEDVQTAFYAAPGAINPATGFCECIDYSYLWTLDQYRSDIDKDEQAEAWDELEKSVIASAADDVTVGVKGNRADIVIIKKFA